MIQIEGLDIDDDFDISKIDEGLTEKAKEIMNILKDKVYVIEDIIEEGNIVGMALVNHPLAKIVGAHALGVVGDDDTV